MFKNRLYFSEQQKRVMEAMGHDGKTFIVLSTGMEIEYTEWCSSPNSKCNWDDARLVYASDTTPKIRHEWGEQEKEEWEILFKQTCECWDDYVSDEDMRSCDEDMEFDWEDLPDIDDLTPDMDEDIPKEHLCKLAFIK